MFALIVALMLLPFVHAGPKLQEVPTKEFCQKAVAVSHEEQHCCFLKHAEI